jgi:hypothetical protein
MCVASDTLSRVEPEQLALTRVKTKTRPAYRIGQPLVYAKPQPAPAPVVEPEVPKPGSKKAMQQELFALLKAEVNKSPKRKKAKPKKLNLLDTEPLNHFELRALSSVSKAINQLSTHEITIDELRVLRDIIDRMSRGLEAYQTNYPPPLD